MFENLIDGQRSFFKTANGDLALATQTLTWLTGALSSAQDVSLAVDGACSNHKASIENNIAQSIQVDFINKEGSVEFIRASFTIAASSKRDLPAVNGWPCGSTDGIIRITPLAAASNNDAVKITVRKLRC